MDLPPSYNEAVASAPPLHLNQEGYPPSPHLNQGEYPPPSNLNQGRHPHLSQPPPTGFVVPAPTATETTVLTTELVHGRPPKYGPKPSEGLCPVCRKFILTSTETMANIKTHMIALILFIIGCWPCCLIPYCMDSCMTIKHSCPSCGAFLGHYRGG